MKMSSQSIFFGITALFCVFYECQSASRVAAKISAVGARIAETGAAKAVTKATKSALDKAKSAVAKAKTAAAESSIGQALAKREAAAAQKLETKALTLQTGSLEASQVAITKKAAYDLAKEGTSAQEINKARQEWVKAELTAGKAQAKAQNAKAKVEPGVLTTKQATKAKNLDVAQSKVDDATQKLSQAKKTRTDLTKGIKSNDQQITALENKLKTTNDSALKAGYKENIKALKEKNKAVQKELSTVKGTIESTEKELITLNKNLEKATASVAKKEGLSTGAKIAIGATGGAVVGYSAYQAFSESGEPQGEMKTETNPEQIYQAPAAPELKTSALEESSLEREQESIEPETPPSTEPTEIMPDKQESTGSLEPSKEPLAPEQTSDSTYIIKEQNATLED